MSLSIDKPLKSTVDKSPTDNNEKLFEPPMNTDEHRLKADKEKRLYLNNLLVLFMFLSVFIGVHRWLKKVFNLLNQDLSVCVFCGSL